MAMKFTEEGGWVMFAVKVVPGASRDRVAGEYDGGLKVTVAKAASDGAANRAVIDLLARELDLAKNQIEIVRGHSHPRKMIRVRGISVDHLCERFKVSA
jgi:hypothetical protein